MPAAVCVTGHALGEQLCSSPISYRDRNQVVIPH